jgi:hypothetical protein
LESAAAEKERDTPREKAANRRTVNHSFVAWYLKYGNKLS